MAASSHTQEFKREGGKRVTVTFRGGSRGRSTGYTECNDEMKRRSDEVARERIRRFTARRG